MLVCQEMIFLAATISSVSVVFADVLVQPGYRYDNNRPNNSPHQPAVPQQRQSLLPAKQYYAKPLADQQLIPYLKARVPTIYPYYGYQDYYRSHLVEHPVYRHHPYVSPHHLHYAKIGGHGYTRPSVYLNYPQPVTGHRFRRSVPDAAMEEVGKSAVVKHDDGVATKSPLITTKYSTVVDSLLQKDKSIGTDDKRSEGKRQVKTTLFGLFPENMHRGSRNLKDGNPPVRTNLPMNPSASVSKSMANSATTVIVEPMKTTTTTSQGTRREDQEHSKDQQQNQTPFTELEQPSSPTSSSSSNRESDEESPLVGASDYNYYDTIYGKESVWPIVSPGIYTPVYEPARYEVWNLPDLYRASYAYNFPNPGPSYASWKFDAPYQQNAYQVPDKKPSLKSRIRSNKERGSKTNQLLGASNPDGDYKIANLPCKLLGHTEHAPVYSYIVPSEPYNTHEPMTLLYPVNPDFYATSKSSDTQGKPAPDVVQPSPYVPQILPLSSGSHNSPVNARYVAAPQTYYHPALTYGSAPFEGTFSSPTYY